MKSQKRTALISICILALIPLFKTNSAHSAEKYKGKKVIHIDSYHEGYEWSDDIFKGIKTALKGTGIEVRRFQMDTKRNGSEEFKKEAGLKAKAAIEEFKPDVIIASDDNASKYALVPYFKDGAIPVVFSGVNWDHKRYEYPWKNATGMEEVDMIPEMIKELKRHAKGNRVGMIGGNDETTRNDHNIYNPRFFDGKLKSVYPSTFDEFKTMFLALQKEVDMIIFGANASIKGWDNDAAEAWLLANTKVPTAAKDTFMARYVLATYAKEGTEQGEYPAKVALKILDGAKPSSIPVTQNKKVKLMINMDMAKKLGAVFSMSMLKVATVLQKDAPKKP
jgi:ABC-type uncharacterized transport system substrate-binding protein